MGYKKLSPALAPYTGDARIISGSACSQEASEVGGRGVIGYGSPET
jgi:hypothetical protein